MTTTPRQRGDAFERRVRHALDAAGYRTWRSSASSTPADVLALRFREVNLVQCKADGRLDPRDWNELLDLADELGATAILAQRTARSIEYRRLLVRKGPQRDGDPLWEPWEPLAIGW